MFDRYIRFHVTWMYSKIYNYCDRILLRVVFCRRDSLLTIMWTIFQIFVYEQFIELQCLIVLFASRSVVYRCRSVRRFYYYSLRAGKWNIKSYRPNKMFLLVFLFNTVVKYKRVHRYFIRSICMFTFNLAVDGGINKTLQE